MQTEAQPRVSIIVPVKNIRDLIGEMVKDLKAQSVTDWELLLITGVSEDGTDEVCRKLAEEDTRITVLERRQPGVSGARNEGIEHAGGTYLVFPDGDDRLEKDYLERLLATIEEPGKHVMVKRFPRASVQMGMTGYFTETEDEYGPAVFATPESGVRVIGIDDLLCRLFFLGNYQGYVWNKIFRRDIIMDNGIRFDEDIDYHEDQLFLVRYLLCCEAVRWDGAQLYHYRLREDSAMGQLNPQDGKIRKDVLEKEMTEVEAFHRMRKLLKHYSDPQWFCEQNMVFYALDILGKMETFGEKDAFVKSSFRKLAKEAAKIDYEPMDEWEEEALPRLKHYGKTGKLIVEEGEE
ncbi:MAG: glycosyltransferase family 2 protein [Lachnospiraceae bacterium]|nr:glycosyltransferase family 2 protein [Lachnospiraceae bacterium]